MRRGLLLVSMVAGLAVGTEAMAASFTLTDADKRAAIRTGERSVSTETFDHEWRVSNGGGETAMVLTPFHRLTVAARHAAFKNDSLKPAEVDRVVKENVNRLVVWVNLKGRGEDFARFYVPRLVAGEREIKASFVQNERTALREEDGKYAARCIYVFPADGLDPKGRVTLVVRDAEEREVAKFTVDLAAMR